jgi:hypothetical protein
MLEIQAGAEDQLINEPNGLSWEVCPASATAGLLALDADGVRGGERGGGRWEGKGEEGGEWTT